MCVLCMVQLFFFPLRLKFVPERPKICTRLAGNFSQQLTTVKSDCRPCDLVLSSLLQKGWIGLIYEGTIGQPRQTTSLCDSLLCWLQSVVCFIIFLGVQSTKCRGVLRDIGLRSQLRRLPYHSCQAGLHIILYNLLIFNHLSLKMKRLSYSNLHCTFVQACGSASVSCGFCSSS